MIFTVYALHPNQTAMGASASLLGSITWDSASRLVCRYTPESRHVDSFLGWSDRAEFFRWLAACHEHWSMDPDKSYFSDMAVDIGL